MTGALHTGSQQPNKLTQAMNKPTKFTQAFNKQTNQECSMTDFLKKVYFFPKHQIDICQTIFA